MNPNEPKWYTRLSTGPLHQEPRPTSGQLQSIQEEVTKVRKQRWFWKTSGAAFCIALIGFIVFTWSFPMNLTNQASDPANNMDIPIDTETIPTTKMFSIKVDTPKNLQSNKLFVVNSSLINNSNSSWEVEHGADMITYDVYDMKGELVLQDVKERSVNAIGIRVTLQPNDSYSYDGEEHVSPKYNELALQAGSYEIVSKAKFRIKHDGKEFDFEIESTPFEIKVS